MVILTDLCDIDYCMTLDSSDYDWIPSFFAHLVTGNSKHIQIEKLLEYLTSIAVIIYLELNVSLDQFKSAFRGPLMDLMRAIFGETKFNMETEIGPVGLSTMSLMHTIQMQKLL